MYEDKQNRNYLHRYGVTAAQVRQWVESQGERCAVCNGRTARLNVDHDHKTGRVRGLLCYKCNSALGSMGDDPTRLRAAIRYLEKHAEVVPFAPFSPEAA